MPTGGRTIGAARWLAPVVALGLLSAFTGSAGASSSVSCTLLVEVGAAGPRGDSLPLMVWKELVPPSRGGDPRHCSDLIGVAVDAPIKLSGNGRKPGALLLVNRTMTYPMDGPGSVDWSLVGPAPRELISAHRQEQARAALPRSTVQARLDEIAREARGQKPWVVVTARSPEEGLRLACPIGVRCDATGPYRAFNTFGAGIWIRLSFLRELPASPSLADLRKHFTVASIQGEIPVPALEGWLVDGGITIAAISRAELGRIKLLALEQGRLRAEVTVESAGVTARLMRAPCVGRAPDAPIADACKAEVKGPLPVRIAIDVPLETGFLDCTGRPYPKRCGF